MSLEFSGGENEKSWKKGRTLNKKKENVILRDLRDERVFKAAVNGFKGGGFFGGLIRELEEI